MLSENPVEVITAFSELALGLTNGGSQVFIDISKRW